MNRGRVIYFNKPKGFGKILDNDGSEIFIHFSQIVGDAKVLLTGEEVEYEFRSGQQGMEAIDLHRLQERLVGVIDHFDMGYGFIISSGTQEKYFIHSSDLTGEGFTQVEEGNEVEFTAAIGEKGLQAKQVVVRDTRTALQKFAHFADWINDLEILSKMTMEEQWDYQNNTTGRFPVLGSYITYTFKHLQSEQKLEYATRENGLKYAAFNTGLVTKKQEEIFAFFEHVDNKPQRSSWREDYLRRPQWRFDRFEKESYRQMNIFKSKPRLANYFQNPADLVYDVSRRLVPDYDHILTDREARFPESFQQLSKPQQVEKLKAATATALMRVERNYKTAIPQFYNGCIQLLLPLCLDDIEKTDVALAVAKEGEVYRANTVLPLDWAYNNARLLARPDREWLNP